jgi:hypothetical protein
VLSRQESLTDSIMMLYAPSMKTMTLTNAKCRFCNHEWIRRTPKPLRCPACGRKQGKTLLTLALGAVLLFGVASPVQAQLDSAGMLACERYLEVGNLYFTGRLTDQELGRAWSLIRAMAGQSTHPEIQAAIDPRWGAQALVQFGQACSRNYAGKTN